MRNYPKDDDDQESLARLNAEPWMVEYLKLNPEYPHWGPGEDYMSTKGDGWAASQIVATWKDFGPWGLDDLNECVHFYFEIDRDSKKCAPCDGSGYSASAKHYQDQWYGQAPFSPQEYGAAPLRADHPEILAMARRNTERAPGYYGVGDRVLAREVARLYELQKGQWCHHLIQADVDALVKAERLWDFTRTQRDPSQETHANGWTKEPNGYTPTADEVNAWSLRGMGHDAINQSVCVRARCERDGVPVECAVCDGHGYTFTESRGHLGVTLWMIHPRKGAARGVRVERLTKPDAAKAIAWLKQAAQRNAERFAKVVAL